MCLKSPGNKGNYDIVIVLDTLHALAHEILPPTMCEQYMPHLTAEEMKTTELEWAEEIHTKKLTDQVKEQYLVFKITSYQNIKVILLYLDSLESREYIY